MSSPSRRFSLHGKTVVVTGATRGVGRGIAVGLAECGAHVVVTGRTATGPDSLDATAQAVRHAGGTCATYVVDHSDDAAVARFFDALASDLAAQRRVLDVFVNNAYSGVPTLVEQVEKRLPFWDTYTVPDRDSDPGAVWDVVNAVGLRGCYVASVLATRLMIRSARTGLIVSISSIGGLIPVFNPAYGAGKSSTDRMFADFAHSAPPNVRYTTFYPGCVATDHLVHLSSATKDRPSLEAIPDWNFETPLYVGRTLAALLASPLVAAAHGRIVLAANIGDRFGITDEHAMQPLSIRSIRFYVLMFFPWMRTSPLRHLLPRRMNVPWWLIRAANGAVKFL